MKQFPPNIDPQEFSLLAIITGSILRGNYNTNELNAIGNWIELLAQYLLTVAAQQYLINSRNPENNATNNINNNRGADIDMLIDVVNTLSKELEEIKKKTNL